MHDRVWFAQRCGFWVWMLGGGLCAAAAFGLLAGENRDLGLHALGGVFAFTIAGYALLARRSGAGTAGLLVWGLGFGLWFPALVDAFGPVTRHWLAELGVDNPLFTTRLHIPLAIVCAGASTAALLYAMTRSARVVLQTLLLSVVVALTPLVPVHEEGAVLAGIIAWHVAISGSLYRWMMDRVSGGAGMACASCGLRLGRLSRAVCPGCGRALSRSGTVVSEGFAPAHGPAPSPAGRWY